MNRTEDVFLSHEHLWSYRTRTVDPNSLTIRSVTHNGILQHSTAETLCEEAARISTKELVELKNANHCPFTFNEYLSYYFYKIYLAYNCSENAIIKNRWIIRNLIDPNITTDPLLHNIDTKYLKDLINACKAYCEGTEYAVAKLLQLFSDDIWKHGEVSCNPAPSPAAYKKPQTTVLLYTSEQLKIFLNAVYSSSCPHRLEFLLALFCGLHTGEILGLTYKDFTPCTRVLEIHHQYIKNKQPSPDASSYIYKQLDMERIRDFQVPDFIGEELVRRQQEKKLKSITRENGLPSITMSDLSNMFVWFLIQKNCSLEKIRYLTGGVQIGPFFSRWNSRKGELANGSGYKNKCEIQECFFLRRNAVCKPPVKSNLHQRPWTVLLPHKMYF